MQAPYKRAEAASSLDEAGQEQEAFLKKLNTLGKYASSPTAQAHTLP